MADEWSHSIAPWLESMQQVTIWSLATNKRSVTECEGLSSANAWNVAARRPTGGLVCSCLLRI